MSKPTKLPSYPDLAPLCGVRAEENSNSLDPPGISHLGQAFPKHRFSQQAFRESEGPGGSSGEKGRKPKVDGFVSILGAAIKAFPIYVYCLYDKD